MPTITKTTISKVYATSIVFRFPEDGDISTLDFPLAATNLQYSDFDAFCNYVQMECYAHPQFLTSDVTANAFEYEIVDDILLVRSVTHLKWANCDKLQVVVEEAKPA